MIKRANSARFSGLFLLTSILILAKRKEQLRKKRRDKKNGAKKTKKYNEFSKMIGSEKKEKSVE